MFDAILSRLSEYRHKSWKCMCMADVQCTSKHVKWAGRYYNVHIIE